MGIRVVCNFSTLSFVLSFFVFSKTENLIRKAYLIFYEDLSWGGLRYYDNDRNRPTEIYTATVTSQADKDRIENVIANELQRNSNSKGGKPCE